MIELQKTPFPNGQKWGFFVSYFVSYSFPNPFPLSARRKRFRFLFRFLKPQETATRFLLMQKCIRKRALFGGCFQTEPSARFNAVFFIIAGAAIYPCLLRARESGLFRASMHAAALGCPAATPKRQPPPSVFLALEGSGGSIVSSRF
jgi:hypothetical protein